MKRNTRKKFIQYLLPSLGGAMVMSIYTMADAIVVGKGIGSDGIAALSLTAPPYSLLMAFGLLIGIGTSVRIGVEKGAGREQSAKEYFTLGAGMTAVLAVVMSILYVAFLPQIVRFVGAGEELYSLTYDYLIWLGRFAFLIVPSTFLSSMLRADGDPNRAMVGVITGGVINIALDILLVMVWKIGIGGAAIASCAGMLIQDLIFLSHFVSKKNTLRFTRMTKPAQKVKQIATGGLSSFINELANGFIVLLLNRQILEYLGISALSVYGVISNCIVLFNSLYSGIGQAAQPLVSFSLGGGRKDEVADYRKMGLTVAAAAGTLFMMLGILFPTTVGNVFMDITADLEPIARTAIPRYFLACIPMAINVFATYYLQAVLKERQSFIISLARNIVLSGIFILLFPVLFGGESLWIVIPVVEILTLLYTLWCMKRSKAPKSE